MLVLPPVQVLVDVQGLPAGGAPVTAAPTSVPVPTSLLEAAHLSLPVSLAVFYPRVMGPRRWWPHIALGGGGV